MPNEHTQSGCKNQVDVAQIAISIGSRAMSERRPITEIHEHGVAGCARHAIGTPYAQLSTWGL
jgi:hypothetical protein